MRLVPGPKIRSANLRTSHTCGGLFLFPDRITYGIDLSIVVIVALPE